MTKIINIAIKEVDIKKYLKVKTGRTVNEFCKLRNVPRSWLYQAINGRMTADSWEKLKGKIDSLSEEIKRAKSLKF